jgi:hypothetical protein
MAPMSCPWPSGGNGTEERGDPEIASALRPILSRLLRPPLSCEAPSPILKMQTLANCLTEMPDLAIYSINDGWRSVPFIGEYK